MSKSAKKSSAASATPVFASKSSQQSAIVDRSLFDAVQTKLTENTRNHSTARMKSEALLVGRIFDDSGNRMSPSHARKGGVKYRYYLSSALLQGAAERAGSVCRAPAVEIETQVIKSVRERLKLPVSVDDRSLIDRHVARVEVQSERLVIQLLPPQKPDRSRAGIYAILNVPWRKTPSTRRKEILPSLGLSPHSARPIRSETRATLVASIARGSWLDELLTGADVESLAKRERYSARQVNMTISLAFLAPDLVRAAIEGRLPRGIGVTRLRDAPAEWSRQHTMLGLAY
jgi:site-specific DNA recombinase